VKLEKGTPFCQEKITLLFSVQMSRLHDARRVRLARPRAPFHKYPLIVKHNRMGSRSRRRARQAREREYQARAQASQKGFAKSLEGRIDGPFPAA
jgi:hypothetical protein